MSRVTYSRNNMTITVDGLDTVANALGDLKRKTPAATKVAINATAREARKLMIAKAKARYAVNAAGQRHLKDLVQRKKATNTSLTAELHIEKMRNDLGYFRTNPAYPTHYTGRNWVMGPDVWKGKVLKESGMKPLPGRATRGPAFLAEFKSGHVGMVQRVKGSNTKNTVTEKGHPRWRNSEGKVEKLLTVGSPSAAAMHRVVWHEVEPDVEAFLQERLDLQVQKVLAKARRT